jgi:hypothetical protein
MDVGIPLGCWNIPKELAPCLRFLDILWARKNVLLFLVFTFKGSFAACSKTSSKIAFSSGEEKYGVLGSSMSTHSPLE